MPPSDIIEQFALGPAGYLVAFAIGLCFGSFANVCIYRLPPSPDFPEGMSISTPASRCGACGTPVRWFDNIPVVSYLVLRGRCRSCQVAYSPRYLFVELALGLLVVAVYHYVVAVTFSAHPIDLRLGRFAVYALFLLLVVVVALIDLDTKLILNRVMYPAIPCFYMLGLTLPERSWSDGLIGVAVGYGLVRLIADGYRMAAGRDGMGYGDGKLLAVIGALFGWQAAVVSLFGGSLLGTAVAVPMAVLSRQKVGIRHREIPFGPYLVAGAVLYLFIEGWIRVTFRGLWG